MKEKKIKKESSKTTHKPSPIQVKKAHSKSSLTKAVVNNIRTLCEKNVPLAGNKVKSLTKIDSDQSIIWISTSAAYPTIDLTESDGDSENSSSYDSSREGVIPKKIRKSKPKKCRIQKCSSLVNVCRNREENIPNCVPSPSSSALREQKCNVLRDISVLGLPKELIDPDASTNFDVEEQTKLNEYDHKILEEVLDLEEYCNNNSSEYRGEQEFEEEDLDCYRFFDKNSTIEDTIKTYLTDQKEE